MNLSESSYATMAKRYIYAAYLGLVTAADQNNYVEIKLNNGDAAEGIFKGIESESNTILIKNFVNISKDIRQVDGSKLLSFADVKYMAVKELDPKAYLSKPLKESRLS